MAMLRCAGVLVVVQWYFRTGGQEVAQSAKYASSTCPVGEPVV